MPAQALMPGAASNSRNGDLVKGRKVFGIKTRSLLMMTTLLAGGVLASGAPAQSQSSSSSSVVEIVVTAQKRAQRVQDVPIAVTVVDAAQLARQQVNQINDLERTTPAVEFSGPDQAPGGGVTIRGIGTQVFALSGEPSAGIVVDGVSLGVGNTNNLFDVARVEVLPGPQGMLFGQSASAGVVNISTNAPDPSGFYGKIHVEAAEAGVGSDVTQNLVQLMLNVPLNDTSAVRIAAHYTDNGHIQYDATDHKWDDHSDPGVRVRYLKNGGDWTLNLGADYDRDVSHGGLFLTLVDVVDPSTQFANALAACGITPSTANQRNCDTFGTSRFVETWGLSGQLDYPVGDDTLSLISADRKLASRKAQDIITFPASSFAGNPAIYDLDEKLRGTQLSEEIRIASPATQKLEYTAGVYLADYSQYHPETSEDSFGPFGFGPDIYAGNVKTENTTEAVFGQATYHVTPQWRLILGGRGTLERVADNYHQFTISAVPGPNQVPPSVLNPPYSNSLSIFDRNLSWRAGSQYNVTPDVMVYATAARGYKGPMISDSSPPLAAVEPELPLDFEAGVKSSWFGRRLAVDAVLFHSAVKHFQVQESEAINDVNVSVTTNASSITTQGAQIDIFGRPIPGLTIDAGGIYDDVRYPKGFISSADGSNLSGDELANAPLWKFTLSTEYRKPITDTLNGFIGGDAIFKSATRLFASSAPQYLFNDHWTLGARVGVATGDGKWSVALFVRNLTDVHTPLTLYPYQPSGLVGGGSSKTLWGFYGLTSGRMTGLQADLAF